MPDTLLFPPHIKPVRVGVYGVRRGLGKPGYAFWDGERWGWRHSTIEQANKSRETEGASQNKHWYGSTTPTP